MHDALEGLGVRYMGDLEIQVESEAFEGLYLPCRPYVLQTTQSAFLVHIELTTKLKNL
jgi:hypothetical protein